MVWINRKKPFFAYIPLNAGLIGGKVSPDEGGTRVPSFWMWKASSYLHHPSSPAGARSFRYSKIPRPIGPTEPASPMSADGI